MDSNRGRSSEYSDGNANIEFALELKKNFSLFLIHDLILSGIEHPFRFLFFFADILFCSLSLGIISSLSDLRNTVMKRPSPLVTCGINR